ncbi:MAG: Lrp/AsnC family transcriptional regulator [bacterium]|jgi:Lrp/AsnC family leucine-responsive transcriptional regulator|uniref:Lrp/AsnC family transcriptional regulator n=1 Tax=Ralstonia sp. TaxID=54061 RepID=UPI003978F5A5
MLDETDQRILEVLLGDSRASLKSLAEQVGLSSPSVSERLRRLEERGVIRQYTVEIDPQALGFTLQAMVRVRPMPGKLHIVQRLLEEIPEIGECDKVTGEDCFIARLYVRSIDQLDHILDRVADHAETNTAIVKTQPVRRRPPPLAVK